MLYYNQLNLKYMAEKEIGKVVHYFTNLSVAVIAATANLQVGDRIHIKGPKTDFEQVVDSLQVEKQPVDILSAGSEAGLKTVEHVKEGDQVYLVE